MRLRQRGAHGIADALDNGRWILNAADVSSEGRQLFLVRVAAGRRVVTASGAAPQFQCHRAVDGLDAAGRSSV